VHVLSNMVEAVVPGGAVLDLQVIRPNPVVESDARVLCEVDGESLLRKADDDHHVRKHYRTGADLVEDFAGKERRLPEDAVPGLNDLRSPSVVRERCRLRRLRLP
jgi:hypothetical protein